MATIFHRSHPPQSYINKPINHIEAIRFINFVIGLIFVSVGLVLTFKSPMNSMNLASLYPLTLQIVGVFSLWAGVCKKDRTNYLINMALGGFLLGCAVLMPFSVVIPMYLVSYVILGILYLLMALSMSKI